MRVAAAISAGMASPPNTIGFGKPEGVALDGAGNVYLVDNTRGKVFKVAATAAATPVVTSALNGASFGSGAPLVQGSLASLFGTALAPSAAFAPSVPLPFTLAGVSVTIGGVAAPLIFVSSTQINLQVPWNLQSQAQDVVVKVNGSVSAAFSATVGSLAPGDLHYAVWRRTGHRFYPGWNSGTAGWVDSGFGDASGEAWRHDHRFCNGTWVSATPAREWSCPWQYRDAYDHSANRTHRRCGCAGVVLGTVAAVRWCESVECRAAERRTGCGVIADQ